jgi:hypothetical protein
VQDWGEVHWCENERQRNQQRHCIIGAAPEQNCRNPINEKNNQAGKRDGSHGQGLRGDSKSRQRGDLGWCDETLILRVRARGGKIR